jgi:hypothetical protein
VSSSALPLLGLGVGAATSAIGTGGMAALLWGAPRLQKRDRWTIGFAMVGLVGVGAMLTAMSHMRLREATI